VNTTTKPEKLVSKTIVTKIFETPLEFSLQEGAANIPGSALII